MPYVEVKLVKGQVTPEQRQQIVEGLTDLIGTVMGRKREFTVITITELEPAEWAIGGQTLAERGPEAGRVFFVNMKISKGTSNPEEMAAMIREVKTLFAGVLGKIETANYFIIDELNPDAWGFDGISMTVRNKSRG